MPDLLGCFSAGDNIDEALESVKEAVELHLEGVLEDGQAFPNIAPIHQHQANPDYANGIWAVVDIDTTAFEGTEATRVAMR